MRRLNACNLLRAAPWVAALLLLAPLSGARAASGYELFVDGNRLFRDDLYWAALLRYEQALDQGYDTPLLHYNAGIAHYRAGQYERAARAFERAAAEPALRLVARYNLGLTARAAGDRGAALDWFRQVRDQDSEPRLAELAGQAIRLMLRDADKRRVVDEDSPAPPPAAVERPRGFAFNADIGVGNDDNVYRSPDQAYVDRSQPGNPVVTPVVQSGVYYPVDITARYSVGSFEHEAFFGSYRLAGRYYQDPELENANEFSHQLAFGSSYHRRSEDRERKIYSAFTIAQHDETWYDRDDGSERLLNGEPAGERLSFVRYGPELWARQSFSRLSFSLHGKGQIWNYESVGDLPEYDHEYLSAGLSAQYRFTSTSLIRFEGDLYTRRFGERPSFSLDGTQNIANPAVRYDYVNYGATARQRVTRFFWFGVRYARTERTDEFEGYNDYIRDGYGAEFSLRIGDRLKIRAQGWYRNYNFIRAFAYHEPAAGRRTLETAEGLLTARWQINNDLSLTGSYEYREVASNDERIDYTRGQFMLGLRWQLGSR